MGSVEQQQQKNWEGEENVVIGKAHKKAIITSIIIIKGPLATKTSDSTKSVCVIAIKIESR